MMVIQLVYTHDFNRWLNKLTVRPQARIITYLRCLEKGNFGHTRFVGQGFYELKIDYGPGYRLYYLKQGETVGDFKQIITAIGDIYSAKKMLRTNLKDKHSFSILGC